MLPEPLVSIIIPCFNGESFVAQAIESALAQTLANTEVIVIDDGSTDRSLEIIRSYGDRIRWETGPNRGGSAARNRGIEIARGELIQFLDADDVLFPAKLEVMAAHAMGRDKQTMPICDYESVESLDASPTYERLDYDTQDPVPFVLQCQIQTSSPIHWRSNLTAIGGFTIGLPCSQERDLHLRLVANGIKLSYVPRILHRQIRREGSVSSDILRVLDQHAAIFLRARDVLERRGQLTALRQKSLAEALSSDARLYVRHRELAKAQEYFELAAEVDPGRGLGAFGRWYSRLLANVLGPVNAERLIQWSVGVISWPEVRHSTKSS